MSNAGAGFQSHPWTKLVPVKNVDPSNPVNASLNGMDFEVDDEIYQFRLDTANQCLWRGTDLAAEDRITLTPKAFAILQYLVEHPGRLVTHDEFLDVLWPDVDRRDLWRAAEIYASRDRRYGGAVPNEGTAS